VRDGSDRIAQAVLALANAITDHVDRTGLPHLDDAYYPPDEPELPAGYKPPANPFQNGPFAPQAIKVGAMEFQEAIKAELQKLGLSQWRTPCVFEGPVAVELTFEYRPLASWSAKKIARTHWREVSPEAPYGMRRAEIPDT
jgi:hypothetical protein